MKEQFGKLIAGAYVAWVRASVGGASSPEASTIDASQIKRVLIVRTDLIGDFVMTTPLLRELKRALPHVAIDLIVHPNNRTLAEACPYVENVMTYDASCRGRFTILRSPLHAMSFAKENLVQKKYDVALVPRRDMDIHHAVFLAYLSRAKHRIGWSESAFSEKPFYNYHFNQLLTCLIEQTEVQHEVLHALCLLKPLSVLPADDYVELWSGNKDEEAVKALCRDEGCEGKKLVAYCLSKSDNLRAWPLERFVEIAQWVQKEWGLTIALLGGPSDQALAESFVSQVGEGVVNTVGKLKLRESFALLKACELYIGNDTGPAHMAAAAGIPVVVLSSHYEDASKESRHSPHRVSPWTQQKVVVQPQGKCDKSGIAQNIMGVEVEQVKHAISRLKEQMSQRG